jgi:lipopolysaccharide transport system ATP-binding protein
MYARLAFSVTAHLEPDILLIDEVLSVGDFMFQNKCIDKMLEYKKNGVTIVFVSHNLDSVRKLCNRVVLLEGGRVISDGGVEEGINKYFVHFSEKKQGQSLGKVIELIDAKMENSEGRPCEVIQSGEKVKVDLTFKTNMALKDLSFSIFFRHSSGLVVFDTTSVLLHKKRYDYGANQKIFLRYELRVNLLKGNYTVGCNIFGSADNKVTDFLFYRDNIFAFTVTENISHVGIANLGAECSVEKIT